MHYLPAAGFIFSATSLCAFGIKGKCCDQPHQLVEQTATAHRAEQAFGSKSQLIYSFLGFFLLDSLKDKERCPCFLSRWLSASLSTVFGVWHADYRGWETQEVPDISWGVRVCCAQPLLGCGHHLPLPAADHWAEPLTLNPKPCP